MISQNKQTGQCKIFQSALRHKVRNLRAKVRLLLPMDLCCKYEKRSNNLIKMQHNKCIQYHNCHKKWTLSRQNNSQLYIPDQSAKLQKHLFYKLTDDQIEQIKEDKLYYVGHEFIDDFNAFIEDKERLKFINRNITRHRKIKPLNHTQSMAERTHKSSYSDFEEEKVEKENEEDRKVRRLMQMENIKSKKKIISQEDKTRRMVIKMKRKEKEERHQLNFQKVQQDKQQFIKQKNMREMVKTANNFKKRQNGRQQVEEIIHLSQKLRYLCLSRHSKSANMLYRY